MTIPLSAPYITEADISGVLEVLRSPHLSFGEKLTEFERRTADYVGAKHAIAVNSGTSGLHLCALATRIQPGDEVITSPFSFIASANCILYQNARPVFVDIQEDTLNLNPDLILEKITPRTKAIIGVDIFGLPADWPRLEEIAKSHNLRLIEDSCEALGAELGGRKAGSFGECGVFAFYPNKQITTGEGGIIVTDSDEIASLCRSMRNQGREPGDTWLDHVRLGYNYRLGEISCALGISQLDRIDEILVKRQAVAETYGRLLEDVEEVNTLPDIPGMKRSWFVYVVRLAHKYSASDRGKIIQGLHARGIECAAYFPPIYNQPFYQQLGYSGDGYPVTEAVSSRTIALPFHTNLDEGSITAVVNNLKELLAS